MNKIKFLNPDTQEQFEFQEGTPEFDNAIYNSKLLPEADRIFKVAKENGQIKEVNTNSIDNIRYNHTQGRTRSPTAQETAKNDADNDTFGWLKSFTKGAFKGVTFGLSDVAIGLSGDEEAKAKAKALEESSPWAHGAGDIIGSIASLFYGGALFQGAGRAAAIGTKVAQAGSKLAPLAQSAVKVGAVSAAQGAGSELGSISLEEGPLNYSEAIGQSLKAGLISGTLGAALPVAGAGLGKAATAIKSKLPEVNINESWLKPMFRKAGYLKKDRIKDAEHFERISKDIKNHYGNGQMPIDTTSTVDKLEDIAKILRLKDLDKLKNIPNQFDVPEQADNIARELLLAPNRKELVSQLSTGFNKFKENMIKLHKPAETSTESIVAGSLAAYIAAPVTGVLGGIYPAALAVNKWVNKPTFEALETYYRKAVEKTFERIPEKIQPAVALGLTTKLASKTGGLLTESNYPQVEATLNQMQQIPEKLPNEPAVRDLIRGYSKAAQALAESLPKPEIGMSGKPRLSNQDINEFNRKVNIATNPIASIPILNSKDLEWLNTFNPGFVTYYNTYVAAQNPAKNTHNAIKYQQIYQNTTSQPPAPSGNKQISPQPKTSMDRAEEL